MQQSDDALRIRTGFDRMHCRPCAHRNRLHPQLQGYPAIEHRFHPAASMRHRTGQVTASVLPDCADPHEHFRGA
jgi:hypothetical protein